MEENIIIKRALGFIGPSNDKSFANKPSTVNFILVPLSKDKFLFSLSHLLSVSVSVFL